MNSELQKELLAMKDEDQLLLKKLIENGELPEEEYHPEMKALHEKNNSRLKSIVKEFGWPTISLVGKDASKAAWLLAQHAILDEEFMDSCLELLDNAVKNGDAEAMCFAYLKDRTLTMKDKPQIYGTQFDVIENEVVPFPIANLENVDSLRREMGLGTLEEAKNSIRVRYNL
jgi:hypothetical protein